MAGYNLKDEEEVKEYLKNLHIEYQFGCHSEKNPEVCHLLGDYHEAIIVNQAEAGNIYKKNCDDYNFPRSCTKYGEYVFAGRGRERNVAEAYKYMKKGCEGNDSKGCLDAGVLSLAGETFEKSIEYQATRGVEMLKKSCDSNQERACFVLAGIFMTGLGELVKRNMKDAYKYSLKSCEAGNHYACINLARMHKSGQGAEKSEEMAKFYKKKANQIREELTKNTAQLKFQLGID